MSTRHSLVGLASVSLLAAGGGLSATPVDAQEPPSAGSVVLFTDSATEGRSGSSAFPSSQVERERAAQVDTQGLPDTFLASGAKELAATQSERRVVVGREITLELFDGERLILSPLEVVVLPPVDAADADSPAAPGIEWIGQQVVNGDVMAAAAFSLIPGPGGGYRLTGTVDIGGRAVRVAPDEGSTHVLYELDTGAGLPGDGPTGVPPGTETGLPAGEESSVSAAGSEEQAAAASSGPSTVVKLSLGYANGSSPNVVNQILGEVANMNAALANTGMDMRVQAVGIVAVNYTQHPSNMVVDLNSLQSGSGGLSLLHAERNSREADLVALVVPQSTNYCGIANSIPASGAGHPEVLWQVTALPACSYKHTLSHEFGHLLGGRHNPEVDDSTTPYPYSHGKAVSGVARTIMAYAQPVCPSESSCPATLQFSSPAHAFIGHPGVVSGDASSRNNGLSLDNLSPAVASYRGTDLPGSVRDRVWRQRHRLNTGVEDASFSYGEVTDTPLAGDWNGNTTASPGVVRVEGNQWRWLLRNANSGGSASYSFVYGLATDMPVVGDWDGNGTVTPGVVRVEGNQLRWYLRNSLTSGPANVDFVYGLSTDRPIVGDWDGNGTTTPGVVRGGTNWLLRNSNTSGAANLNFAYGTAGDTPLPGDWDGNDTVTPGVVRGNSWLLRNHNTSGGATVTLGFGAVGDSFVTGTWNG